MKRVFPIVVLVGFLLANAAYVFIYLFRAFDLTEPASSPVVRVWHGDPFLRAILVAVFFLIGLVVLLMVLLTWSSPTRGGRIRLRPDLWDWLVEHGTRTNEPPERIVERAVAAHRERLGAPGRQSSPR